MKAELMEKIRELIKAEISDDFTKRNYGGVGYGSGGDSVKSDRVFAELLEMCSGKGRL